MPQLFYQGKKNTTFGLWKQGGYGFEFIWQDSSWVINKKFEVENKGKNTIWKITYIKSNKIVKILAPYNKYPPPNVLKVDEYYKPPSPILNGFMLVKAGRITLIRCYQEFERSGNS